MVTSSQNFPIEICARELWCGRQDHRRHDRVT
jgi:hypothetical protein